MKYRKELQQFINREFLMEATLASGNLRFQGKTSERIDIETGLHSPVVKKYPEPYLKIPVFRTGKTTLLTNIIINNKVKIDHAWVPYDLIGNTSNGVTKRFICQLYTYTKQYNGKSCPDYGIKIIGVLPN